jgi:hypothetical protein
MDDFPVEFDGERMNMPMPKRPRRESFPTCGWVVVVGKGAFSSCYGVFHTYDDCLAWMKTEGFIGADSEIRPVRTVVER